MAANQVGLDLFYGARLFLGSVPAVLALLLFGRRGLLVGAAGILLVPRLWVEPQAAIVLLAEQLWLAAFLQIHEERSERRERGDIVLADVLFWIVVAIPLDFLLFGVIANVDLPAVLDLSLLQAINGSFNTALAYGLFALIRVDQSRRDPSRGFSLQGLILISLLGVAVSSGLLVLVVGMRQLDHEVVDDHLARFRQLALASTALEPDALEDLAGLRDLQSSPLEFQVLDGDGTLIYDSNPALFQTLESRFLEPDAPLPHQPQVAEPLDLLIPVEAQGSSQAGLRGYWRYETADDQAADHSPLPVVASDRRVVIVEPARAAIRELQTQSSDSIRLLALLVLASVITARGLSRFVIRQIPDRPVLEGFRADDDRSGSAVRPRTGVAGDGSTSLHSGLRELQPLLQALQARGELLVNLRESFRRSERQRHRLEAEVGRLNILDPLTGCFNRRELYRRLDHELRLSGREGRELSFICLEIDHLRHIHDSYGTSVHEEVLRRVALELRTRSRSTDFLCRLGSEQFGLLLPSCNAASALKVAELLSDVIRALEIRHDGSVLSVTLSVGVVSLQSGRDDADSLITRAQSAVYRAKAEGRDRVVIA